MVFSITLLAISLSIDALGVGMVYGLKQVKIPLVSKLIICLFSIVYTGIALVIGKSLSLFLSPENAKLIGIIILGMMGMWIIIQSLIKDVNNQAKKKDESGDKTIFKIGIKSLGITIQVIRDPMKFDLDKSGAIDSAESLLLGLALSVDAIGVGIGSSLMGFYSPIIPLAIGLFQLIFLYLGTYFGKKVSLFSGFNKKALSILPGILLIFLALIRFC